MTTCTCCSIQSRYKMHYLPSGRFLSEHRTPLSQGRPLTCRDAAVLFPSKSCSLPLSFACHTLQKISIGSQSNPDMNSGLKCSVPLLLLSVDLLNLIVLQFTNTDTQKLPNLGYNHLKWTNPKFWKCSSNLSFSKGSCNTSNSSSCFIYTLPFMLSGGTTF